MLRPSISGGCQRVSTAETLRLFLLRRIDYRRRDFAFPSLGIDSTPDSFSPGFLARDVSLKEIVGPEFHGHSLIRLQALAAALLISYQSKNKL